MIYNTAIISCNDKQGLALSLYTQLTQEYQQLTDKLVEMREIHRCRVEEEAADKDKKLAMVSVDTHIEFILMPRLCQ